MFKPRLAHRIMPFLLAAYVSCWSSAQSNTRALSPAMPVSSGYLGFDRNLYPGDQALPAIAKRFAFIGYWLNNPPGEVSNTWTGKRNLVKSNNLGFLVLWNGRLDKEILNNIKRGTSAAAFGAADARDAVQAAKREGFPAGATLFLDLDRGSERRRLSPRCLRQWAACAGRSGQVDHNSAEHQGCRVGETSSFCGAVRSPGQLSAFQWMHGHATTTEGERNARSHCLAVFTEPAPPRNHASLHEDLR